MGSTESAQAGPDHSRLYFLGYAFWGDFVLPYNLTRADIAWTEMADGVLQAAYPSKRRVKLTPAKYGWVLPAPNFIVIDVESWRLT